MPAFLAWPAIKLFLSGALGKLWAFLKSLSFWQIVAGCLAIFALVQHFELKRSRAEAVKLEAQLSKVVAQLKSISTARDTQKIVTRDRIKVVQKLVHEADGKARVIEQAPLPPTNDPAKCKSPKEVLDADI